MGKAPSKASKNDECEDEEFQEAKRVIEEKGVVGAQEMMRQKLERWRDVKVKIGVTGDSGCGKSSFINAFRGIGDEDEGSAKTGVVETTSEPASYSYPDNPNIILVDLPGIGTPSFPNLATYCDKVALETYDTFLILTTARFRQNDLELAKKIKSMGKSFFLIRTKIDQDAFNEKRKKSPDVKAMLRTIRADCYENLEVKDLEIREDEIFLISNYDIDKWDFSRLVEAILEKLPTHQKEALTLSLRILSEDAVRRKVEVFRSQLWKISFLSLITSPIDFGALPINSICIMVGLFKRIFAHGRSQHGLPQEDFEKCNASPQPAVSKEDPDLLETMRPIGVASIPVSLAILGRKMEFFRSQLGLPEEDSDEFKMMKPEFQKRMRQFYQKEDKGFWKQCFGILTKGPRPGSTHPIESVKNSLYYLLQEMQELSLDLLDDATRMKKEEERVPSETGIM